MKKKRKMGDAEAELPLSEDELLLLHNQADKGKDRSTIPPPERKDESRLVRYARKNTFTVATVSIASVAMLLVLSLLFVSLLTSPSCRSRADFIVTFAAGDKKEEITYPYEKLMRDGIFYVEMNRIAEFSGVTVGGSAEKRKFIVPGETLNYLEFQHGSEVATVNGKKILLPHPVLIENGDCLVPYDTLVRLIGGGLSFEKHPTKNQLTVTHISYQEEDALQFAQLLFTAKDFTPAVDPIRPEPEKPYEYPIDIEAYLKYIDPANNEPYLLLANPHHPIGAEVPDDLVNIPEKWTGVSTSEKIYELNDCAMQALVAMMMAMEADGIEDVFVTSSYRSYERQEALFETYVRQEMANKGLSREAAEEVVLTYSARPGTSEHQTGLCVDFITHAMKGNLTNAFENTAAFRWLSEYAHHYGFILRYPADKKDIVVYSYESWHYRFVGRTAATEMYYSGQCLEEYLGV